VAEVLVHSDDLRSFVFTPERRVPPFLPGQFLHLALDPWDPSAHWPESRVFSIASSPLERESLRITVSTKGAFTQRMFDELVSGRRVWLKLPYGSFSPGSTFTGRMVLLAGGSGVTPFVSFLLWATVRHPQAAIDLHYGARRPDLLIYRETLAGCRSRGLSNLRLHCYAEVVGPGEPDVTAGRLSVRQAWECLERPKEARFYLSGPQLMIDAFRTELLACGAPPDAVFSDEWE
jgi:ferredoxin-NADP reductase